MLNKLEQELLPIISDNPTIILGLSGGPDSVFLFHFLKNLHKKNKLKLICAHLDHEWRRESAKDEQFCRNLCEKYKIKYFTAKTKDLNLDLKFNGSKEEMGRKLRRNFLQKIFKEENAKYIALGHHLQDQQETFLFRIIRGSSLSGLTCMKKINKSYIRPLLDLQKNDILKFLEENKIKYIIDQSNDSDEFLRNKIRKYVLPKMQECDSRFNKKFATTLKHLQEEEEFLYALTQETFNKSFKITNVGVCGNLKAFLYLPKSLQKRLIIYWLSEENVKFSPSKNYLEEILRFLKNQNGGSHQLGTSWKVCKKKNSFYIKK